jgi:hypothetical protein
MEVITQTQTTPNPAAQVAETPAEPGKEPTPPAEEIKEPPKPEPTPEEKRAATQFAALARKEKAIRRQQDELKARDAEYQAYRSRVEKAKGSPNEVLNFLKDEFGTSFEDLTGEVLGNTKSKEESRIEVLEKELLEIKTRDEQRMTDAQRDQMVKSEEQFKSFVGQYVEKEKGALPFASHPTFIQKITGQSTQDLVLNTIKYHAERYGEQLDAVTVLQELEKNVAEAIRDILELEAVKGFTQPPKEDKSPNSKAGDAKPSTKTLTNELAATNPNRGKAPLPSLAEAAAHLRWRG